MKRLLIITILSSNSLFGQIISPENQRKVHNEDSSRIAYLHTPVKNMRVVQFGIEFGTQFINDSAQLSRLSKKNLIHYGLNLQIGDNEARNIFTLIGCDFYASSSYQKINDTSQIKGTIWGLTGNFGFRIPLSISKLTTINFGPSFLIGRHGVANSNVNTYGLRLAASVEKRIGTFQCIGYLGVAYDNNGLYKRDKGLEKRNLDQLRIYFGLRF